MRKKDLLLEIEKLQERIKHLEACIKTQDRLLEGYQKREHAVVKAIKQVQEDADRRLAEAEKNAQRIELQAKQESSRLLAQTEATAAEYRDAIERYNLALEYAAAEAAANAERFASFVRGSKLSEGDLVKETEGLSAIPFREPITELPDPDGNPAQLMRNIYRIQNRVLSEEENAESCISEQKIQQNRACDSAFHAQRDDLEETPENSAEELLIDALTEETFSDDEENAAMLPTVNSVLEQCAGDFDNTQELCLDDLLDEIIKSGEQYHG